MTLRYRCETEQLVPVEETERIRERGVEVMGDFEFMRLSANQCLLHDKVRERDELGRSIDSLGQLTHDAFPQAKGPLSTGKGPRICVQHSGADWWLAK